MKLLALTAAVAAAGLFAHCQPGAGCVRGTTHCAGAVAEVCDADGAFVPMADCDVVSAQTGAAYAYVCASVDVATADGRVTGHTCVPAAGAVTEGGIQQ